MGEYAAAVMHYEESVSQWQEMGVKNLEAAESRLFLGITTLHQEHSERAAPFLYDVLTISHPSQHKYMIVLSFAALSVLAVAQKDLARAARLLGAAEATVASMNFLESLDGLDRTEYERLVTKVYSQIDEVAFSTDLVKGRAMTVDQAIAFALKQSHGK